MVFVKKAQPQTLQASSPVAQQSVTLVSPISAKSLGGSSTIGNNNGGKNHDTSVAPRGATTTTRTPPPLTAGTLSPAPAPSPSSSKPRKTNAAATTSPTSTTANVEGSSNHSSKPNNTVQYEYNPRWKGYMYILLASLINCASIGNIPRHEPPNTYTDSSTDIDLSSSRGTSIFDIVNGHRGVALSFSIVTFVYSCSILITDRLQILTNHFHYTKLYNGNVEGISLCIGTLYSIVAVAYMTQVRGIAYLTLNIYFSVWLLFLSFIYTLNKWSTSKDILSIHELTGISATLKSWYVVFLSSTVVTGTCINMLVVLSNYQSTEFNENENARAATLGIVFGFCSMVISFWMILSHYNFIECTNEGGWFELLLIIVIILVWVIATAVLTTDNSIAATISGSGCYYTPIVVESSPSSSTLQAIQRLIKDERQRRLNNTNSSEECYLQFYNISFTCDSFLKEEEDDDATTNSAMNTNSVDAIPGSNLYIFLWMNLLASFHLISRWKAQQALQFAQTQQQQQQNQNQQKIIVNTDGDAVAERNNDNTNMLTPRNNHRHNLNNAFNVEDDIELANNDDESEDDDDDDLDAYDDDRY